MQLRWIAAAGALLLAPRAALAVEPPDARDRSLPCRPTIACTADVVPPGAFELETGVLGRVLPASTTQLTVPFLAKLTLAPWVQAQAGSNGYTRTRGRTASRYVDDATLGIKIHALDQTDSLPSLALSATASLPVSSDPAFAKTYDALFTAYATKDIGGLHLDLNVGANAWRLDGRPLGQGLVALAASANLVEPFGAMLEGYYFSDAAPIAPRDAGVLFAITHSPRPWLVFDFGGDIGLIPSTRAYSVFVGMTVVPFVLWR